MIAPGEAIPTEPPRKGMVEAVLFASSFRGDAAPNINHALRPDRSATICGRVGWVTEEGWEDMDSICCLRCTGRKASWVQK